MAAAGRSAAAPGDLDLRLVWDALLRKKAWIIVPTAVVAALSFAIVNVITPRYKSESRILVDGRENVFLRPNAERVEERRELDPEAITSQVQVVLSRDLAREIIRKNKLNERPEFDPMLQGMSPLRAMLALIGVGRDPMKLSAEERVLEAYYDRLTAYAIDKSRVIAIEFQSSDPDLASRVANSIAEGYLTMQQGAKQDQARSAGQEVALSVDPALRGEPAQAGRDVYRIVQEGLTNARKHAPAAAVSVSVARSGEDVEVEVRNARTEGSLGVPGSSSGLIGLVERATLAGGTLSHGFSDRGEFELKARLPWR